MLGCERERVKEPSRVSMRKRECHSKCELVGVGDVREIGSRHI